MVAGDAFPYLGFVPHAGPINPLRHEENTMMTAEQKKELVRRYYQEIWTDGNLAFADRVFTDDYVNRDPASPGGCVEGREGFKHLVGALRGAFQDMRMTIDHQHVDGEVV